MDVGALRRDRDWAPVLLGLGLAEAVLLTLGTFAWGPPFSTWLVYSIAWSVLWLVSGWLARRVRFGYLMMIFALADMLGTAGNIWYGTGFAFEALHTLAGLITNLQVPFVFHLGLTYPTGRIADRPARWLIRAGWLLGSLYAAGIVSTVRPRDCDRCTRMIVYLVDDPAVREAVRTFGGYGWTLLLAAGAVLLVRRLLRAGPRERRLHALPIGLSVLAGVFGSAVLLQSVLTPLTTAVFAFSPMFPLLHVTLAVALPISYAVGLLRERLDLAQTAAALARDNLRLQAQVVEQLAQVKASRARLVEAGDTARRKLERDLHDGAQQRLVGLGLALRLLAERLPAGEHRLLDEIHAELQAAIDELRRLAGGIHPVVLTDHGLGAAIRLLGDRAQVRVLVADDLTHRPPPPIESAAYFAASEALTNAIKHARAGTVRVELSCAGGSLLLRVRDDGVGGADPGRGSGLRGLADRVAAIDGTFTLASPPRQGTDLRVELPCACSSSKTTPSSSSGSSPP
ncbi:two-component sensor histidine kinase [Acrocarpospora phusangensis]|uniref:histidine kinase n=1 Tax=Acrocarpospora phusangensis TaxID=1070424 RepID=A0A919UNJ0_9ACTN|nr:ATP-binding protein [Acrocarpospora phusangensis]GIH24378.1 two-component sensor histidine kinase [Acrocarpospora phusangensis]